VAYPDVKRELALNFSRSKSFATVEMGHFHRMFTRIGRDPQEAERWVGQDLERALDAWDDLRGQLPLSAPARAALEAHLQSLTLVTQFRMHR